MSRRRIVLLASAAAAVVVVLVGLLFFVPTDNSSTTAAAPATVSSGPLTADATTTVRPTGVPTTGSVHLPAGGTAQLIPAQVSKDGTMSVPDQLDQATWWGATLGAAQGATLLAGHVNWQGRTGPFAELWQDRVGQQVTVVDNAGRDWVYRITQMVTVAKADLPNRAKQLYGLDGDHRLVLATCGGEFVGGTEGYDDNRFAVATLVTRP
ncbi:class F sortase [Kutzneria sp. CA-103260]|uniref:class F sortase n=1 Tax=Kutzneria sp. CA-103260 TaxID=2802641 RepID=UPI001BA5884D|nr:class F sortase [Kutzneria sp. CA-103260]QUQ67980.1 Sortase domain protein [Kutzneria sp. CA-103260]